MQLAIVTINYNDEVGLAKTISSLEAQGAFESEPVQWIFIDGGSTDCSLEVANSFVGRLRDRGASVEFTVISEPDHGIYDAMNKGLKLVHSEYVIFLNSGDYLASSHAIETIIRLTRIKSPDIGLFSGLVEYHGTLFIERKPRPLRAVKHGLPELHQATVYRTSMVQPIMYDASMAVCSDYKLAAEFFVRGAVDEMFDTVVAVHPIHGGAAITRLGRLFSESIEIQRRVLKMPLAPVCLSTVRRLRSVFLSYLLYRVKILAAATSVVKKRSDD